MTIKHLHPCKRDHCLSTLVVNLYILETHTKVIIVSEEPPLLDLRHIRVGVDSTHLFLSLEDCQARYLDIPLPLQ